MKRVLITGVTGRSGSWLVRYLSADPHLAEQYIFRFSHRKTSNTSILDDLPFLFEKVEGDLTDEAFCREICTDVDTLFHIAGIHWSIPLVPAAIECGVKRLILVHTTGVYSKYKAAGEEYRNIDNKIEQLVEKADISLTILRPTMVYGTIDDGNISVFLKMVHLLRFFPVVDHAIFALQPVCHKDLGKAYYEVLIHPEETKNKNYILSGGEPILLIDILKTLGHQLGVKNTFISFPFWLVYSAAWCLYLLTFRKIDYREKVQRLVEPRIFSHEDATRDFGYAPVTFEVGVKEEVEMYKKLKGKCR